MNIGHAYPIIIPEDKVGLFFFLNVNMRFDFFDKMWLIIGKV